MSNVTKRAAARAFVAHDHECGGAFAKAFANIGAAGFFADGEQVVFAQNLFDFIKTIFNNEGNGKIGKTIYVGKGSNAPRHKIKMLVEENKIKKTTIIENSDTVIFDKKIIFIDGNTSNK